MNKIKSLSALTKIVRNLKAKGKKIVFTNGCFDLIHHGHVKVLKTSKKKGDILIVGLNSDTSVRKIKGSKRPIVDQRSRACVLESIQFVDFIILFNDKTPYKIIQRLKPDYLVKGGDWSKKDMVGNNLVKKTFQVKLEKGRSSTDLIEKILENYLKSNEKKSRSLKSNRRKF